MPPKKEAVIRSAATADHCKKNLFLSDLSRSFLASPQYAD